MKDFVIVTLLSLGFGLMINSFTIPQAQEEPQTLTVSIIDAGDLAPIAPLAEK